MHHVGFALAGAAQPRSEPWNKPQKSAKVHQQRGAINCRKRWSGLLRYYYPEAA
jgi:hypothetical protein